MNKKFDKNDFVKDQNLHAREIQTSSEKLQKDITHYIRKEAPTDNNTRLPLTNNSHADPKPASVPILCGALRKLDHIGTPLKLAMLKHLDASLKRPPEDVSKLVWRLIPIIRRMDYE